jgi:hypothetical protein
MGLYKTKVNPTTGKLQLVPSGIILTFKEGVSTFAALPAVGNSPNDSRITNDTGHLYVWDGVIWVDQGDIIDIDWSAITGKPTSSVADIDDAVFKRHTQNTDQYLDFGGTDQSSATDLKDAITKKHTAGTESVGGDVSGTVSNVSVEKIKGSSLPTPSSGDDGKVLTYESLTDSYTLETSGGGSVPPFPQSDITGLVNDIKNLQLNVMLNAFRLAIQGSITLQQMIDSFIDEYEDENNL